MIVPRARVIAAAVADSVAIAIADRVAVDVAVLIVGNARAGQQIARANFVVVAVP